MSDPEVLDKRQIWLFCNQKNADIVLHMSAFIRIFSVKGYTFNVQF